MRERCQNHVWEINENGVHLTLCAILPLFEDKSKVQAMVQVPFRSFKTCKSVCDGQWKVMITVTNHHDNYFNPVGEGIQYPEPPLTKFAELATDKDNCVSTGWLGSQYS